MSTASAQLPPTVPDPYSSPPITIILTVILLVFFFVGFFCIYFCRCFMQNLLYTWHLRHSPTSTPLAAAGGGRNGGLDPSIIHSFPTFTYSSVKDYRKEKYGLECAICLVEFDDSDVLRLMTSCCHVFHQECIDLWLESHHTCPVCRRNLEIPPENSPVATNSNSNVMHDIYEDELLEDSVSITIKDDDQNDHLDERAKNNGTSERECCGTSEQANDQLENKVEKFSRSHSTGHSIVKSEGEGSEEDKYTLRLPEHVKAKIIRGHNSTQSCTTFGEYKSKTTSGNGGFGEASGTLSDRNNKAT